MKENPKEKLINILTKMGYEEGKTIFLQGSMPQEMQYPDSFWTFWNIDTPDDGFYDNEPTKTIWSFYLWFFSNNPSFIHTELEKATTKLKENGWIIGSRKGNDVSSDYDTHTGRYTTIYFIEREEK